MSYYATRAAAVNRPTVQLTDDRPFWRKDDPELINPEATQPTVRLGGMWPTQRAWYESPNFIKVIVGGFGSGKTFTLCKRMMALGLENAPMPVAIISPTYAMAIKTVVPTLKLLMEGKRSIYGRQFAYRYVQQPMPTFTYRFHGRNAVIWVLSSDRPMSLRGPNLAAAGIDEPFMQPKLVFDEMLARVRSPEARHRELCIAGTPEQLNWGYQLCMGELGEQHAGDVGVYTMSSRENLSLPKDYIPRMEASYTERAICAYIDGEFLSLTEGQVYYAFSRLDHVVSIPRDSSARLVCGMDFNVNPMAAVVSQVAGSHMHAIDVIELPNSDTEEMATTLREKYPELHEINPDASGKARKTSASGGQTDFTILKKHGFHISAPAANPPIKDRENAVNGKFKPKNGRTTLTVDPSCKKLIEYLMVYSHPLKHKADQKAMSHVLDAFSYSVHRQFPLMPRSGRSVGY